VEIAGQDAELPEIRTRSRVFSVLVVLALLGLATRLFYLQIVQGEAFYDDTTRSIIRTTVLPAVRGEIRDRKGRIVATTRPAYLLRAVPSRLTEDVYRQLARLLGPEGEALPPWSELAALPPKERDKEITLVDDLSRDRMAVIGTALEAPGLRIQALARRHYPQDALFAHVAGYMNEISAEELRNRKDDGYAASDLVGRTGIERQWESYLRGAKGFEKSIVDRRGIPKAGLRLAELVEGPARVDPSPGNNVVLTLDVDVQRIVDRALRNKLAAAAVVVDVATGRFLALASRPSFSPNLMSGRLTSAEEARFLTDRRRPFIDKTLGETYNPGSTFKAISAIAALEEHVMMAEDRTRCTGFVQIGRRRFKCRKVHGLMNLHNALVQSCNSYFYELGARPGMMNRLAKYAVEMGLGAQSGLGLNGEAAGFVPTEEWHREQQARDPHAEGFVIGHALNTAIGEGATRVTVMQMALLYAAIANGGKLWLPQVVERVESPAGDVVMELPPRLRRDVAVSADTLALLRRGLAGVVADPHGTAYKARSHRVAVAGKTGTAQVQRAAPREGVDPPTPYERLDHAWFAGFAPVDQPRIAFAVLVEHGGAGGEVAAPVAMEIVDGYFDLLASGTEPPAARTTARTTPAPRTP
jgi:penicillin-binding protein 2